MTLPGQLLTVEVQVAYRSRVGHFLPRHCRRQGRAGVGHAAQIVGKRFVGAQAVNVFARVVNRAGSAVFVGGAHQFNLVGVLVIVVAARHAGHGVF